MSHRLGSCQLFVVHRLLNKQIFKQVLAHLAIGSGLAATDFTHNLGVHVLCDLVLHWLKVGVFTLLITVFLRHDCSLDQVALGDRPFTKQWGRVLSETCIDAHLADHL